jgi:dihydrofolate reductase
MRKLTYLVAVSLDGFIAAADGSFDAFSMEGDHIGMLIKELPETLPAPALSAMGITPANTTFDTVVMGWNTFAVGLAVGLDNPYPHLRQVVFGRSHGPRDVGAGIELTADDPVDVVRRLKAESSDRDIWLCGGGALAASLADEIDRLVLKVNPVVLGSGISLFRSGASPLPFQLEHTRRFESGVVVSTYSRRRTATHEAGAPGS